MEEKVKQCFKTDMEFFKNLSKKIEEKGCVTMDELSNYVLYESFSDPDLIPSNYVLYESFSDPDLMMKSILLGSEICRFKLEKK